MSNYKPMPFFSQKTQGNQNNAGRHGLCTCFWCSQITFRNQVCPVQLPFGGYTDGHGDWWIV